MKPFKTAQMALCDRKRGICIMAHGGTKTYLPTLLRILTRVCQYIIKYRKTIEENLPENGDAALAAVLIACEGLIAIVDIAEPGG
jgi:hypothetical protein